MPEHAPPGAANERAYCLKRVRRNIVANYAGSVWTGVMAVAFIPVYIRCLGVEAYGLVGFYMTLFAAFSLFDMGLSPMLNREMAQYSAGARSLENCWTLLRSVECVLLIFAAVVCLTIGLSASWLARNWLDSNTLSVASVAGALQVCGPIIGLRLFESVYRSAVVGLQRQVWLNGMSAITATLRWAGVVPVLLFVQDDVFTFFVWQAFASAVTLLLMRQALGRWLPPPPPGTPRFRVSALRAVGSFSSGLMLNALLALLLKQSDKIVLSKLLSLEQFGIYMFAANIAGMLLRMRDPVAQALYPRFSELATEEEGAPRIAAAFHKGTQLLAVTMGTATVMLVVFGEPLVALWSGDGGLAATVAPVLALTAVGTLANGLMAIPYMLQLAHGWVSLSVRLNIAAVLVTVPAIFIAVPVYGMMGAAMVWASLNLIQLLGGGQLMFRRLLVAERWSWYGRDLLAPIGAAAATACAFQLMFSVPVDRSLVSLWLLSAAFLTLAVGVVASSYGRPIVMSLLRSGRIFPLSGRL
jgi:O-antigen/teichoic acid export membrane protein